LYVVAVSITWGVVHFLPDLLWLQQLLMSVNGKE